MMKISAFSGKFFRDGKSSPAKTAMQVLSRQQLNTPASEKAVQPKGDCDLNPIRVQFHIEPYFGEGCTAER